jgi:hypothetical protein
MPGKRRSRAATCATCSRSQVGGQERERRRGRDRFPRIVAALVTRERYRERQGGPCDTPALRETRNAHAWPDATDPVRTALRHRPATSTTWPITSGSTITT